MADFTLNPPGSAQNPWTPSNILLLNGTLNATTSNWIDNSFDIVAVIHNANYGATITSTITIQSYDAGDDIFLGSHVRTGANAANLIGVWISSVTIHVGTYNATTQIFTGVSSNVTITTASGDTFSCTVAISGGVATVNAFQNSGGNFNFDTNTTSTYASESSLAAGHTFFPQNRNQTFLNQFTGTGVLAGTTIAPNVGAVNTAGNTPTVVNGINTVLQPFVAERKVWMPPARKIFLPPLRKAA